MIFCVCLPVVSWKTLKLSWKSHGILFSGFYGNPVSRFEFTHKSSL